MFTKIQGKYLMTLSRVNSFVTLGYFCSEDGGSRLLRNVVTAYKITQKITI
jgi:hypothetical protein